MGRGQRGVYSCSLLARWSWVSKLWRGKRFSLLDTHSDRPWDQFSLFHKLNYGCHQGMKRPEYAFDHPPLSAPRLSMSRALPLLLHLCPRGMYGVVFTLVIVIKGKGKVIPLQARCGPEDGYRYSSTLP